MSTNNKMYEMNNFVQATSLCYYVAYKKVKGCRHGK